MIRFKNHTEKKAAGFAFSRDSCSRLNSVLESTPDLVIAVGRNWMVSYANSKAVRSSPGLRLGEQYWKCFPWIPGTAAEKYHREVMEGRSEVQYEALYPPHDKWYKVSICSMDHGISVFLTDVTDEKAFENKLALEQLLREKRVEALSHMAGGLAHEISNPLAIIHGWAHDLQKTLLGKAQIPAGELAVVCDKILKTTDRASNILRGLKAFGRDGAHDPTELASIYTILDDALELLEARFERNKVQVRTDLQPDIPLFPCREIQIGQILANLLNNALEAILQSEAQERWVCVKAVFVSSEIWIDVSDSGPGIQEQQMQHLMKPFFTTKELGLGMGVGLSLSRAIAQSHGGSLTLLSESKPTCFRLCLPVTTIAVRQDTVSYSGETLDELEEG